MCPWEICSPSVYAQTQRLTTQEWDQNMHAAACKWPLVGLWALGMLGDTALFYQPPKVVYVPQLRGVKRTSASGRVVAHACAHAALVKNRRLVWPRPSPCPLAWSPRNPIQFSMLTLVLSSKGFSRSLTARTMLCWTDCAMLPTY